MAVTPLTSPCTTAATRNAVNRGNPSTRTTPSTSNTPVPLAVSSLVRQDTRRTFSSLPGRHVHKRETHSRPIPREGTSYVTRGLRVGVWGLKIPSSHLPSLCGTGRPSHNLVDAAVPRGTWDSSGRRRTDGQTGRVSSGRRGADISPNECMCDRLAIKCACRGRRRDGGRAGGGCVLWCEAM